MKDEYVRKATVVRVIDGDTVVVDVDLGFYVTVRMSCRLLGINAPEMPTPAGLASRSHLVDLLATADGLVIGVPVTVQSIKPDKYAGRFDGVVITHDGTNVNDRMLADGFAVPYNPK